MNHLDGLPEFVAVVEAGTFSSAARQLSVSVSHVSRQIAALEQRLGTALFLRTTRQMQLTPPAKRLFDASRPLLEDLLHAQDNVLASREAVEGPIRVSLAGKFAEDTLVPCLARFAARHPNVELEVDVSVRNVDLIAEGFHLAIRLGPLESSQSLTATRLASFPTVVLASSALLATLPPLTSPAKLPPHRCLPLVGRPWHFVKGRRAVTVQPTGKFASNTGAAMVQAALEGLGLVNVPAYYAAEVLSSGRLKQVLREWRCAEETTFNIVCPAGRHTPLRVRRLIDFLRGQFEA